MPEKKIGAKLVALGIRQEPGNDGRYAVTLSCNNAFRDNVVTSSFAQEAVKEVDDELVIPARALSAGIIEEHWLDITESALKAALPLFNDVTIYANHRADVREWYGKARNARWDEGNENMPAGVNFDSCFPTDSELLKDDPGYRKFIFGLRNRYLYAFSVTIFFKAERSHKDLDGYKFYDMLGTEVDGEVVRFVVNEITRCSEISVVWDGADPYAKALSAPTAAAGEQLHKLQTENTRLQAEKLDLNAQIGELTAALETTKTELSQLQTESKELHVNIETIIRKHLTLLDDSLLTRSVEGQLENATLAEKKMLGSELAARVEERLPIRCLDCGSANVERRSSLAAVSEPAAIVNPKDYKTGE